MQKLLARIEHFFFRSESASGIGMLRAAWGAMVLWSMLPRSGDVLRYYSDNGLWPPDVMVQIVREQRFSILDYVHDPQTVVLIYVLLITSALFVLIGLFPRVTTIITAVLLASFHERNHMPLAGGDSVLRLFGILLMVLPGLTAFSVHRLWKQWNHFRARKTLLPPLRIPAWPRLLITWQLALLYVTCVWFKLYGETWLSGTASAFPFHHDHFARFNPAIFDAIPFFYSTLTYFTLVWELAWIFFLIPPALARHVPILRDGRFRRWMLLLGLLYHGGILLTLSVGNFSLAMFTAYLGVLKEEDFAAIRKNLRKFVRPVTMLFDGSCRACLRITFLVKIVDHLHAVRLANIRSASDRFATAPTISLKELDRVVHVRLANGTIRSSYSALRTILSRLPVFWVLIPFLWFPGTKSIGTPIYDFFAMRRRRCEDGSCEV